MFSTFSLSLTFFLCAFTFSHTPLIRPGALGGHCTSRARLHVRARILNRGMHVPIAKHRKYEITFGRITFIFVFVASWRNSWSSQIYQKCAPGHQAPKTAPDGASGAYFQVGFWWSSKLKFLMLVGSTTRPLLGASGGDTHLKLRNACCNYKTSKVWQNLRETHI